MKIAAIIVTYNRLEKLKKCLTAYEKQTLQPSIVCVVDNHSTDGTEEYLQQWKKKKQRFEKQVIRCKENLGGAGGFAAGIQLNLNQPVEWIWISDDDAYPEPECLATLADAYTMLTEKEKDKAVAICAKVTGPAGISMLHRRYFKKKWLTVSQVPCTVEEYERDRLDIDCFSFVGTAIKREIIQKIGLPREDYFIFYDDTEYSLRVREKGHIMCFPGATIWHDSIETENAPKSWKYYYLFRNWMYTYKLYYPGIYFRTEQFKIFVMICRYFCNRETWIQFRDALKDVRHGKLGKSNKYYPY